MEFEEEKKDDNLNRMQLTSNIKNLMELEDEIEGKIKKRQWKESYKLICDLQGELIELNSFESFEKLLEIRCNEGVDDIELNLKFKVCSICCVLFLFLFPQLSFFLLFYFRLDNYSIHLLF